MKFRRKSTSTDPSGAAAEAGAVSGDDVTDGAETPTDPATDRGEGPYDAAEVDLDEGGRVDLGSLLISATHGREVRVQVDEKTQAIQAVMVVGPEGALEMRAFAAARNADMWSDVREQIVADVEKRGGTVAEHQGRWGTELLAERPVSMPDGTKGVQAQRIIGINGPRWFLRATLLGGPARSPEEGVTWEETLAKVVVRRGTEAMPPGDPLPVVLPTEARRVT